LLGLVQVQRGILVPQPGHDDTAKGRLDVVANRRIASLQSVVEVAHRIAYCFWNQLEAERPSIKNLLHAFAA
jgi:hypothetical protein